MIKKLLVMGVCLIAASAGKPAYAANVQGVSEGLYNPSMLWPTVIGWPLYAIKLSDITDETMGCTDYVKVHAKDEIPEEIEAYYESFSGKKVQLNNVRVIEKKRQPHSMDLVCEFDTISIVE
ncbi:MAG: hypothetical protein ACRBDL_08225 [Alphaproteobacteria bacterium]